MREKDQLFAGPAAIAFATNIICLVSTMEGYRNPGSAWVGGSPIQLAIYSFSPLLAFAMPFIIITLLYKIYSWNENIGFVLCGSWFGVEGFDLIVRLYNLIP